MNGGFTPASGISGLGSTDNAIVRTNGTGGNSAQGSLVTIDDSGNISGSTGAFTSLTSADVVQAVYFVLPNRGIWISNFLRVGNDFELQWATDDNGQGNATIGARLSSPAANSLRQANGTDDQRLSIGAASGTGGGVVQLHISTGSPVQTSGDISLYSIDRGIGDPVAYCNAACAGFFGVPGSWTIDTGWTANADSGDKTAVIPSSAAIATIQTAANILAAGLGDLIAATAEKVKALEANAVSLIAPNH